MQIVKLTPKTTRELLEQAKVKNRMSKELMEALKKNRWKISDYAIERKVKGIYIAIEFCMGDFCTGIYSKKGKWLLEKKVPCETFGRALTQALLYETRIRSGEHWKGETH